LKTKNEQAASRDGCSGKRILPKPTRTNTLGRGRITQKGHVAPERDEQTPEKKKSVRQGWEGLISRERAGEWVWDKQTVWCPFKRQIHLCLTR